MARVLIIDDSTTVAASLSEALSHDGHDVATLSEFSQLGSVLDKFDPDVLVLDLLMPGFSGIQFARFVQRFNNNPPPIILHSGSDPEMMKIAAREIKPFEVVPKGTNVRDLRRAVARGVSERRRRAMPALANGSETKSNANEGTGARPLPNRATQRKIP